MIFPTNKLIRSAASVTLIAACLSGCSSGSSEPVKTQSAKPESKENQAGETGPQVITGCGHAIKVIPPPNFTGKSAPTPFGQMMVLTSPKRADGKNAVFSLSLVQIPPEEPATPEQIIESMVNPYRTHLMNFKEAPEKPFTVQKHNFTSRSFEGNMLFTPIKSFVCATPSKNCMLTVQAQDTAKEFDENSAAFHKSIESLQFMK